MFDLTFQIAAYLLAVFLFGLTLGWLLWSAGWSKQSKVLSAEVEFWKNNLEQSRAERQRDIDKIAALSHECEKLKKRLSAKPS